MSSQPLVPADDSTLSTAHQNSPATTLAETTRRALALYALLDNPEELLDAHGVDGIPPSEIDESRK